MKIIILGAGQVGSSLAEALSSEKNDITVVDTDSARLKELQDQHDLNTLVGSAAQPKTLFQSGANDADMVVAVTASDEVNLAACRIAASLFNAPNRIARLRAMDYLKHPEMLEECFAVNQVICPEQIVTDTLVKLVEFPEALQVLEFADGLVSLVAMRAYRGGPLVQHPLKDLKQHMPNIDVRVPAIFRQGKPLIPTGDTVVQPGDEVFCLAPSTHIREVMAELRRMDKPVKRIMIAGGGNIGMRFAQAVEKDYDVKIIEWSKKRGEVLAQELDRALVLNGDSTDEDLLYNEHVEECDMFLALTNDDENNIMSALLAKRMGARRVVALINRKAYADLMQGGQIDIAISPAQVTIGSLLQHIRQGDVVAVHSLRRGAAEAIEVIAHGDRSGSKVIGRAIRDIELPKGASIAALTRKGQAYVAHDEMVIEPDDHLIVFVGNKKMVPKVEKLFTVSAGFF